MTKELVPSCGHAKCIEAGQGKHIGGRPSDRERFLETREQLFGWLVDVMPDVLDGAETLIKGYARAVKRGDKEVVFDVPPNKEVILWWLKYVATKEAERMIVEHEVTDTSLLDELSEEDRIGILRTALDAKERSLQAAKENIVDAEMVADVTETVEAR